MQKIALPSQPIFTKKGDHSGQFEINGLYPGYGMTMGNSLRRVLLSSLNGTAIVSAKVKGASHEFTTLDGVMEDVVQISLNLKKVRFRWDLGDDTGLVHLSLKKSGDGVVTAGDIKTVAGVTVVNPEHVIATVTDKKTEFEMEVTVAHGRGYVPIEQQEREVKEIGVIAIDAVYTPIRRVNYTVENMRVGKRTDFNRVLLDIETDGGMTPEEAFAKAVEILVEQFSAVRESISREDVITSQKKEEVVVQEKNVEQEVAETEDVSQDAKEIAVVELNGLSTRTTNVLETGGVKKVGQLIKKTEEQIMALDGMGEKGVKEIRKAIGMFGLTLKQ
ncbi:MAG: DNA-directed RNA polymerase subunit alpha [Candidatus Moranbacteria bacterium]|nr:DNA-directed RNA polymerase subunit alpha [Candidatus Moranbacteria bacterium]